jgi:hypothetical protein
MTMGRKRRMGMERWERRRWWWYQRRNDATALSIGAEMTKYLGQRTINTEIMNL